MRKNFYNNYFKILKNIFTFSKKNLNKIREIGKTYFKSKKRKEKNFS